MMIKRKAEAVWNGDLKTGTGRMSLSGGAYKGPYSFASRFERGEGTNPEELIGAAHAGCFSMALAHILAAEGYPPESVATTAEVMLEQVGDGFAITGINLETTVRAAGLENRLFQGFAEKAKQNCPVSKALAGPEITLRASLEK